MLSYPGLIFQITNMRTGEDITPSYLKLCCKPIFVIEKVRHDSKKISKNKNTKIKFE